VYGFKGLLFEPIFKFYDPTYRISYKEILQHVLKYGIQITDDRKFSEGRFKELITLHPNKKIFIMGHSHVQFEQEMNGYKCLITDTWRTEYDISNDQKMRKQKTYAKIHLEDGKYKKVELKTFTPSA